MIAAVVRIVVVVILLLQVRLILILLSRPKRQVRVFKRVILCAAGCPSHHKRCCITLIYMRIDKLGKGTLADQIIVLFT